MDILFYGQLIEIAAVLILLLVLMLLYRFGEIRYFRDFGISFLCYFILIILSIMDVFGDNIFLDGFIKYGFLIAISFFLIKPFVKATIKSLRRSLLVLLAVLVILVPFILGLTNKPELQESVGYIIMGAACVLVGVSWMRYVLIRLLATKVVGVTFILFGLHLMSFVVFRYDTTTLAYGYLIAASLEILIALCLIFLNFAYLKEQDAITYSKYSNLFNNASDAILLINDNQIFDCNSKAEALFETTKDKILKLTPMDLSIPIQENGRDTYHYGVELFRRASEGELTQFDWIHLSATGKQKMCEISLFKIEAGQFAAIIRDMTAKYAYEEELNFHKYYDALTHLPKRELFLDRLSRSLEERYKQVALIAFNIDNFKEINDEYGHEMGDAVLKSVAEKVSDAFSSEITMTRLGGDEFIIMMDKLSRIDLIYLPVEKVQSVFYEPFEVKDHLIKLTVCIGVAFPENQGTQPMDLLKNVDLALNLAKSKGRGRLEFYSEQAKEIFTNRINLERDMRMGLSLGEFVPYYQPMVHVKTGEIIGAEALARWIKLDGSIVYPDIFIPIAEETELINAIGNQMLMAACKACKTFLEVIPNFVMHVNLSPLQLQDESIIKALKHAMETHELTSRHLAVEITEAVFIHDMSQANHILRQIRDMGIGVALDDFGTGYASLSYLNVMQVDTIKIDRSFVVKLPGDNKSRAMIEYLTGLMQHLGYNVIIEGVEEKDQADYLKSLGCDAIQGYYYYRPMPYEQLENLLK